VQKIFEKSLDTLRTRCYIAQMPPVQLESFDDARRVWQKNGWICCECLTVNLPARTSCSSCDKQRWSQLGFDGASMRDLQERLNNA
jgi:hypothetical protein